MINFKTVPLHLKFGLLITDVDVSAAANDDDAFRALRASARYAMPMAEPLADLRGGEDVDGDEISLDQPRLMKRTTFRLPRDTHCVPH